MPNKLLLRIIFSVFVFCGTAAYAQNSSYTPPKLFFDSDFEASNERKDEDVNIKSTPPLSFHIIPTSKPYALLEKAVSAKKRKPAKGAVKPAEVKSVSLMQNVSKDGNKGNLFKKIDATVLFKKNEDALPKDVGLTMASILQKLKSESHLRVQLASYSSQNSENEQDPSGGKGLGKRIALLRGLNMRAWLIEKGIESSRIDIKALGFVPSSSKDDVVSQDRIDVSVSSDG